MKQTKPRRMVITKEEIIDAIRIKFNITGDLTRVDFRVAGKDDPDDWQAQYPRSYEFEELIIEETLDG